jgi:hypothetical protein
MDATLTAAQSAVSLSAFPKDNITLIFGNQNLVSRRQSSNRESFGSLYDNQANVSPQRPISKILGSGISLSMPNTAMCVCSLSP